MEAQFPAVLDQEISDLMFLEVRPQIFDWVAFGGVSGEFFQPESAGAFGEHRLDQQTAVDRGPVPDDQEFAGQVPEQGLQELGGPLAVDAALVDAEIELPESQTGDDRELVPVESLAQHRRLPAGRPRAHPMGPGAQSALVDEDDGPPFLPGFFLRRGQSTRFQRAMATSSRSMARRVGCWQLNPRPRRTRQTWPG
jgi:hypothetical protein